jgi:hypothetical protein
VEQEAWLSFPVEHLLEHQLRRLAERLHPHYLATSYKEYQVGEIRQSSGHAMDWVDPEAESGWGCNDRSLLLK